MASWRKQRQLYKRNTRSAEWSDKVTDVSGHTNVSFQNSIHEEIKSRMKSGNACCHLAQDLSSPRILPKNTKIKMYRTIILLVVLYGCENWSLTLREKHRPRVFENRVLRKISGLRGT
jgi:hypothetical protein